jgi:cation transport regulator ChaC
MHGRGRWIFGYGSLVWRPAFPRAERRAACVRGWARRFWQGSPDHRGVRDAPGRVLTLVPRPEALCWGVAYRVEDAAWDEVLAILDERESGGFERRSLEMSFDSSGGARLPALTYVAGEGNANFLGRAPLPAIAAQIRAARGRSGSNLDYALQMAAALRAMRVRDAHVFAVAELLAEA